MGAVLPDYSHTGQPHLHLVPLGGGKLIHVNFRTEAPQAPDFKKGAFVDACIHYEQQYQAWHREHGSDESALQMSQFRLEEYLFIQSESRYPMCIKKIPENIHAYVVPWAHDTIIYNSHYLESHEAGKTRTSPTKPLTLSVQTRHHHAHVIEHESKHLDQARHWGSRMRVPGWEKLGTLGQEIIGETIGAMLSWVEIVEGLTEKNAIEETGVLSEVSYNGFEVPHMKKMDELVFRITGISLQEEFDTMSQSGSDVRFARALQHTANFLILQRVAAKSIKHPLTQTQNDTIILVSRLLGDHTITDFSEAANILVHVSASLLGVVDTSRTGVLNIVGNNEKPLPRHVLFNRALSGQNPDAKQIISVAILQARIGGQVANKLALVT